MIVGIVLLVVIVTVLLFVRHRRLNAGATNRLVLNDTVAASNVGYGSDANPPRGFMNPMYDDPTDRVSGSLKILLIVFYLYTNLYKFN